MLKGLSFNVGSFERAVVNVAFLMKTLYDRDVLMIPTQIRVWWPKVLIFCRSLLSKPSATE